MANFPLPDFYAVQHFGRKAWGDKGYAIEELVAEPSAAFLCADLEDAPSGGEAVREEHALRGI